jgi:hypothetical protein
MEVAVRKAPFFVPIIFLVVLGLFSVHAANSNRKEFGFQPKSVSLNVPGKMQPLTGPGKGNSVDAVLQFMQENSGNLGIEVTDLADVVVTDQYVSRHNGVTHMYFRQRINGIEVFGANAGVHIDKQGRIISVNSSMIRGLNAAVNTKSNALSAEDAIAASARFLDLAIKEPVKVQESLGGPSSELVFSEGAISLEPIRAKLVYQPISESSVRLAWQVEIYELNGQHWWNIRVDALSGEVLALADLVDSDEFKPSNGSPDAKNERKQRGFVSATAADDAYNVFAIPKESPSDGPRTLEVNPADALASPFGWHDTDGSPGSEFTVTRGNNAHAYTDLNADNVADPGSDPDGGSGLVFDFPLDLTQGPSTYRPAAVANLFYWNNIIHDVFYQYGFDEPAGNFQVNNYGKGGLGNDDVRAEAQDGFSLNNANFGTPVDGLRPRMQMFVWVPTGGYLVTVNGGPIAGDYVATGASFGAQLSEIGPVTGDVSLVNDGVGATSDGCEPFVGFPAGNVALLDRGACTFVVKVQRAQAAGASAVIVANNAAGPPVGMGGSDPTATIAALMISQADGVSFKANLPLNATLRFAGELVPSRDSDLDNGVIVHEYGHGISNRLTGGPSTVACLQNAEQMGEGWSDWLALTLTADPADTKSTARGIGTYVIFEPPDGVGIRPTQYSTDVSVNPTTYGDIGGLVIPHGVGYAWSTMLWEMYWNLIDVHGFNSNVYDSWSTGGNNLAIQLVIDGMKLQACSPGFVDGRDAILIADQNLTGGENQCQIWRSFAKRGLGFSANQGLSTSTIDGTEAFDLPAECIYDFDGFFPPVDNPPDLNKKNAGANVPVKFSLGGDHSLGILETGYPVSQQIDCTTKAPIGPTEPTNSNSGLTFGNGKYHYNWKTLKAWEGTCRQLIVRLDDGTDHIAYFKFK